MNKDKLVMIIDLLFTYLESAFKGKPVIKACLNIAHSVLESDTVLNLILEKLDSPAGQDLRMKLKEQGVTLIG